MADYSKSLLDEPDHNVVNLTDDDENMLVVRVQQTQDEEINCTA